MPMIASRGSGRQRMRGFTLIEVLVAILVMGVGVLGVTGLQLVSLQNNSNALARAEAVQLAYDMVDRVRANAFGNPAGIGYDGLAVADQPPTFVDCQQNACTSTQMRDFDQTVWKCALGGFDQVSACGDARSSGALPSAALQPGLPQGDGSVDVAADGTVTVTVQWLPPTAAQPMRVTIQG